MNSISTKSLSSTNDNSINNEHLFGKQFESIEASLPSFDCPKAPELKPRNTNFIGFFKSLEAKTEKKFSSTKMMAMENLAQYSPFFRSEDGKCQFYIKRILIFHQKIDKHSIIVQTLSIGLLKSDVRILTLLMNFSNLS